MDHDQRRAITFGGGRMSFLKQLFTDQNGQADEMATLAIIGFFVFLSLEVWTVYQGKSFDPQAFGIGYGACLGAAAAGMGWKAKLEK